MHEDKGPLGREDYPNFALFLNYINSDTNLVLNVYMWS